MPSWSAPTKRVPQRGFERARVRMRVIWDLEWDSVVVGGGRALLTLRPAAPLPLQRSTI